MADKEVKKSKKTNAAKGWFAQIAAESGGETLEEVGVDRGFIDTNILSLNYTVSGKFVGGGIPVGTICEIYGPSSTGKSLLAMNIIRGVQDAGGIGVYLDAERAVNKDFAKRASRVNAGELIVLYPDTLKESFNKIHSIIQKIRQNKDYEGKPICIVYDSIAVSPSDEELAETTIDMENATEAEKKKAGVREKEQPGSRARTAARELRKLMPVVAENDATIVVINQLRNKIGVMFGSPLTTAGGGESLKYYCSTRLEINATKSIKDKRDRVLGMETRFKTTKSRHTAPHQKVEGVRLDFERGIDPFGGLLELMIQTNRIEGSRGRYTVREPWAGGMEVKFTSSAESGRVPLDILLKCPLLVDADTPKKVEFYSDLYGNAIEAAEDTNIVLEAMGQEDE